MKLILASSSRYRQTLLGRLQVPFKATSPEVDETALPGESPTALAHRLANAKAEAIASKNPIATVIGSDQVASVAGEVLGKPGTFARAREQLMLCSARQVVFHTALCVIGPNRESHRDIVDTVVYFRTLKAREIEHYLQLEQPYDCAGSFKCEGLGISLFEKLESEDPTALEGLPLIKLSRILRHIGFDLYPQAAIT